MLSFGVPKPTKGFFGCIVGSLHVEAKTPSFGLRIAES